MESIEKEIEQLTARIQADVLNADLYFSRGKLYWKLGRRGEAMSDFNRAVDLDPRSPAAVYLDIADDIMDFYNTDLYNP